MCLRVRGSRARRFARASRAAFVRVAPGAEKRTQRRRALVLEHPPTNRQLRFESVGTDRSRGQRSPRRSVDRRIVPPRTRARPRGSPGMSPPSPASPRTPSTEHAAAPPSPMRFIQLPSAPMRGFGAPHTTAPSLALRIPPAHMGHGSRVTYRVDSAVPPPAEHARPLADALELSVRGGILLEEDGVVVGGEDLAGGCSDGEDGADGNLLVGGRLGRLGERESHGGSRRRRRWRRGRTWTSARTSGRRPAGSGEAREGRDARSPPPRTAREGAEPLETSRRRPRARGVCGARRAERRGETYRRGLSVKLRGRGPKEQH